MQSEKDRDRRALWPAAVLCSSMLLLSTILLVSTSIGVISFDPNRLAFPYARSDGRPAVNLKLQYIFGAYSGVPIPPGNIFPSYFSNIFSCDAIATSFHRNESYKTSDTCRLVDNELSRDVDGDGEYGDSKGYIYPGAPKVVSCKDYYTPSGEVCLGTNGCPTDSVVKYYSSGAYVNNLLENCRKGQPFAGYFVANAIVLFALSFATIAWLILLRSESQWADAIGYVTSTLSMISFMFILFTTFYFFSLSGVKFLDGLIDCSALPAEQYYAASKMPVTDDKCFVLNATCDPYDYSGGYFQSSNERVGSCEYLSAELYSVNCAKANDVAISGTVPIADCEDVDCEYLDPFIGAAYQTQCCKNRRKCCGDDAFCSDSADVCQWSNATVTFDSGEKVTENKCYNQMRQRATKCNDKQRAAFNQQLRTSGVCFPSQLNTPPELVMSDAPGAGATSAKCRPNGKNRLIESAVYFGAHTDVPDYAKINRDIVQNNLPECIVQKYHPGCGTPCFGHSSVGCDLISPGPNAPANCTFVHNVCKPLDSNYATPEIQKARPSEYCESLYDGTSQETIDASKTKCLSTDLCYWSDTGFGERCLSKTCSPRNGANGIGYNSNINPPCVALTKKTANGYIPPAVKVCDKPSKGCSEAEELPVCYYTGAFANDYYYRFTNSEQFTPGLAFDLTGCKVLSASNCTASHPTVYSQCVLIKGATGPECTSIYTECPGGQIKDTYYLSAAETQADQVSSDLSGANCYRDINGAFISSIHYDLYLILVFFILGLVIYYPAIFSLFYFREKMLIFPPKISDGIQPGSSSNFQAQETNYQATNPPPPPPQNYNDGYDKKDEAPQEVSPYTEVPVASEIKE